MQVQLGCYACVVKRAIRLAGLITDDLETKKKHIDAMLKQFLATTQFIVISHNRQTIAEADALYGVTMEKRGISKIVSMRFRSDLEKDTGGR